MTEQEACIILNLLPGIGNARYQALIQAFGSGAAALSATASELRSLYGFGPQLVETLSNWRRLTDLSGELALAANYGVQLLTLADSEYPEVLREIHDPPLCLYVKGTLPPFPAKTVAIVGSRRMSAYGKRMAEKISAEAVQAGWIVASGLAFGVDVTSHRTVLNCGGITVAVLGSGLCRVHPQEHVSIAAEIVESGGALISEFPMAYNVNRRSLPRRNRIVSGLATAVIVVEAGVESGAMITAKLAADQGREVFAVPGQADNPQAAGCNRLIRDGAKLTCSFGDVLEEFEVFGAPTAEKAAPFDLFLSGDEQLLCSLLEREGCCNIDALVAASGLDTGAVRAVLMKLEMDGLVRREPGEVYARN